MNQVDLKKISLQDADAFSKLANNKKIWLYMRDAFPNPYYKKDAIEFITKINESPDSYVFGIWYCNNLTGAIGLHFLEDINRFSVELGYWIGEPFWNKGIATQAVKQIIDFGFRNLNINRIYASTLESNIGSQKVLLKNNFKFEGISRKSAYKNGKFLDEHRFGLLKYEE